MKNILSKTKAVKNGMVANANVQSNKRMNGYLTKQQERQKSIEAEAASRRQVVQRWQQLAQRFKYQKAASRVSCSRTTQMLEEELFDGILLNLNERNSKKSYCSQKRILRRIVEKRQAQMAHRHIGRSDNMFANHMQRQCVSQSMKELRQYQMCI